MHVNWPVHTTHLQYVYTYFIFENQVWYTYGLVEYYMKMEFFKL